MRGSPIGQTQTGPNGGGDRACGKKPSDWLSECVQRVLDGMLGALACMGVGTLLAVAVVVIPVILFFSAVVAVRLVQILFWSLGL